MDCAYPGKSGFNPFHQAKSLIIPVSSAIGCLTTQIFLIY